MTCLAILLSKRFNAAYIGHFGMAHYAKAYREYEEEQLHVVKADMKNSIFEDSPETFEKTKLSNIKLLKSAEDRQSSRKEFTYKVFYYSHLVSEITASIGLVTLLLFSVFLSQAIVGQK